MNKSHRNRLPGRWGRAVWALLVMLVWTGCTEVLPLPTDGNAGLDPKDFPNQRIEGEPNDTFANPVEVILDSAGRGHLGGSIRSSNDIDVYTLGALSAGDRIIVDVGTPGSSLDAILAIFDEGGRIVFENDDRDELLSQLDPFLNDVFRHDSSVYYLVIAQAPLAANTVAGSYDILITVVFGGAVPSPNGQVVVLDFDGGQITFADGDSMSVGPFNTADISLTYSGMTEAVRNQIKATVEENFEGLNLDLRMVPGDALPPAGTFSNVLFGGERSGALGLAQSVDAYNSNTSDSAIILTEKFTPEQFGRTLSATELGIAIGNVATHETGHLLGLHHVADILAIMDTIGSAATLLEDQEFINTSLDSSVFPLGSQDSMLLLLEILGAAP